jgi:hypothetical protein
MPAIPATQKVEVKGSQSEANPSKSAKTLSEKQTKTKREWLKWKSTCLARMRL